MSDGYKVYYNESLEKTLSSLVVTSKLGNNFVDVSRKKVDDLCSFFDELSVVYDKNNRVREINFDDVKVKASEDIIDFSQVYNFNIRSAYVATIDKKIINDVINFYDIIKMKDNGGIIFDASRETRLQTALNTALVKPESKNVKEDKVEEKKEEKLVENSEEEEKSHFKFFWFCVLASLILTILSILIVVGIIDV